MEISQVSTFFDRTPVLHPVSGTQLCYGQLLAYDESKRDSAVAYRRMLSVAQPAASSLTSVVRIHGEYWLVGDSQLDGWDTIHRRKFVLQRVTSATLKTPAEFLSGAAGVSTWSDVTWRADRRELEVSSYVPQEMTAALPSDLTVSRDQFLLYGAYTVFMESVAVNAAGFNEAHGRLQLQTAPANVTIVSRTYSQATGGHTTGSSASVPGFLMRWQDSYEYAEQSDAKYQEGDKVLLVPVSATVTTSSRVDAYGRDFSVLQVRTVSGVQHLHLRPVA